MGFILGVIIIYLLIRIFQKIPRNSSSTYSDGSNEAGDTIYDENDSPVLDDGF